METMIFASQIFSNQVHMKQNCVLHFLPFCLLNLSKHVILPQTAARFQKQVISTPLLVTCNLKLLFLQETQSNVPRH